MTTALDLIKEAAKLAGILFKSEELDADEANDGLTSLNNMLASWSNFGLLVTSRTWDTASISAASSYSIGSGQTINVARPTVIIEAYTRLNNTDYPMTIITDEEYQQISSKSSSSNIPDYINYDNGYPYGTIRFYPKLSASTELHLLSEKPLTTIASLSTSVTLPPGGNRAAAYNLALEMSPQYGQPPSPIVIKIAADSLRSLQMAVAKNRPIKLRNYNYEYPYGKYNIITGP